MTEPSYLSGWLPEAEFRVLKLDASEVTVRSVMRRSDGAVWCAPLGTPDFWPENEGDEWTVL